MQKEKNGYNIQILIMFVALLVSIWISIYQVIQDRKEMAYSNFINTLQYYDLLAAEHNEIWKKIKKGVSKNPKTKHEVHDKQDSLGYLLLRMDQSEPMYSIEHGLLEVAIRSLNLLNALCEKSNENENMRQLLYLTNAKDIAYYQIRLQDLLVLYKSQRKIRLFPKPKYEALQKAEVGDYFDMITEVLKERKGHKLHGETSPTPH